MKMNRTIIGYMCFIIYLVSLLKTDFHLTFWIQTRIIRFTLTSALKLYTHVAVLLL